MPAISLPRTEHLPKLSYFCINREKTVGIRYEMRESHINYELVEFVMPAVLRSEENPYAPSEIPEEPVLSQNSLAPIQGSQQSKLQTNCHQNPECFSSNEGQHVVKNTFPSQSLRFLSRKFGRFQ